MIKPSDYLAVKIARHDEAEFCRKYNKPESESAIIAACDAFLRLNKPPLFTAHIEKTLTPRDK